VRLERVDSRAVTHIGYDPAKQVVRVIFTGGGAYDYFGVPGAVYKSIRDAGSIGTAVNQVLKQYEYEPVRRRKRVTVSGHRDSRHRFGLVRLGHSPGWERA